MQLSQKKNLDLCELDLEASPAELVKGALRLMQVSYTHWSSDSYNHRMSGSYSPCMSGSYCHWMHCTDGSRAVLFARTTCNPHVQPVGYAEWCQLRLHQADYGAENTD